MPDETVAGTTADPTIKFIPLTLGKKTYLLCYDFNAVAQAEALTGMALLAGVDWTNITALRLRAMLYACALRAQPDVQLNDFTPHIRHKNMSKIQASLFDAWTASTPEDDEENASAQNDSAQNPPQPSPETAD